MEEIVRQTLQLNETDNQTHIKLPFTLTKEYTQLVIQFTYSPQVVAQQQARQVTLEAIGSYFPAGEQPRISDFLPLVNLLTLSLNYQERYLGCHHNKQPNQEIVISPEKSSFGFLTQRVLPGAWEIQLNAHCIQSHDVQAAVVVSGVI